MVISGILTAELPAVLPPGAGIDSALSSASADSSAVMGFLAAGAWAVSFTGDPGSPAAHAKDPKMSAPKRRDEKTLAIHLVPRMITFPHKQEHESNPFQ